MRQLDDYMEKLVKSWEIASEDLGIEIETPFYLDIGIRKLKAIMLIKYFGNTNGTLIIPLNETFSTEEFANYDIGFLQKLGYYISYLNLSAYEDYNREHFIDTLLDWGFYGEMKNKPSWYEGHVYDNNMQILIPIKTPIGTFNRYRDNIILNKMEWKGRTIIFYCNISPNGIIDNTFEDDVDFKLIFYHTVSFFHCEYDTYESLHPEFSKPTPHSSVFELIENSKFIEDLPIKEDYDKEK
jgi:hypothetical protein